ncbi:MAG: pyridoxamine 5'-phosphate oxidase [Neisseriaceae bacterium]|nr:pyridoxamine 5'-phosphate oxidase [Neisseriaceae bacterium]
MNLHHIRQDYAKQELSIEDCAASPIEQFQKWLQEAMTAQVNEPTAMNVATVDAHGQPSARMVLLKEVNDSGFVFFTNYRSRKGREIEANPQVALTFFWAELEREVRIEGLVEKLSAEQSDEYFASRPYTSKAGAWASHQSEPLNSKPALLARAAVVAAKYPLNIPRPPFWGGYLVVPHAVEFWQGRPSRLHDRVLYLRHQDHWEKSVLSP